MVLATSIVLTPREQILVTASAVFRKKHTNEGTPTTLPGHSATSRRGTKQPKSTTTTARTAHVACMSWIWLPQSLEAASVGTRRRTTQIQQSQALRHSSNANSARRRRPRRGESGGRCEGESGGRCEGEGGGRASEGGGRAKAKGGRCKGESRGRGEGKSGGQRYQG